MSVFETENSRWTAILSRDPLADGKFVYCVKTTRIYCRPVCKARLARRSNVTFLDDSNAAESNGFRPCKRCKPELETYNPRSEKISKACATILASALQGKEKTLRDLAAEAELTQSHFHRIFKSVMGVTPKTHAAALLGKDREAADLPYSRPASLSPPRDQSSSNSNGPGTPNATSSPLVVVQWKELIALESTEPAMAINAYPDCLQPHIEFTIQPWQSGYVLIAASHNEVRAIDVGDSHSELVAVMRRRYPTANLLLSDWTGTTPNEIPWSPTQILFMSVMEALENPTGRMLHLPINAFEVYG